MDVFLGYRSDWMDGGIEISHMSLKCSLNSRFLSRCQLSGCRCGQELAKRIQQTGWHESEPVAAVADAQIQTGAYEIDADELVASDRLLARHPDAQIWLTRVGSRYARHFSMLGQSLSND